MTQSSRSSNETARTRFGPYRVLMIAPTSFFADYGCHVRILEEVRILQKLGHHVTVVTYHNGHDVPDIHIERTLPIPWRKEYEVGSSRHKIGFDLLLGWKALTLLARRKFDLIHAHLHEGAFIGEILSRTFDVPMLFDFQGSLTAEMVDHGFLDPDSRLFEPVRRLETWISRSARAVLTSSAHARRILIDQFGCRPDQVQALPDCVNADFFRPALTFPQNELEELRRHLKIPTDRRLIVYLGLLAEHQGISHLLEATAQLYQQNKKVHLLLMGFPNIPIYQAQAEELQISEAVTFTGRVPYGDAPLHLALGDVAAAPKLSLTEGSGKLLNYMAAGLPTVAFDTPVAREYLGGDGYLAQRGDVESLAQGLDSLLFPSEDPEGPSRMGERLRRRARYRFGWESAGHQIEETYAFLTGDRKTAPSPQPRWVTAPLVDRS